MLPWGVSCPMFWNTPGHTRRNQTLHVLFCNLRSSSSGEVVSAVRAGFGNSIASQMAELPGVLETPGLQVGPCIMKVSRSLTPWSHNADCCKEERQQKCVCIFVYANKRQEKANFNQTWTKVKLSKELESCLSSFVSR